MPFVSSSGRKLYIDGPKSDAHTRKLAYAIIVAAIVFSSVAIVRLGAAAAASVAASTSTAADGASSYTVAALNTSAT